ncbi:transcriptional initiation protein Tat [Rothia sp. HMSC071B01]|nr:transcriptional initiation protein Tat [Rothia sp. HMSC071B01]
MMSHISRRKVVKGVAWATPVIAASSVVPAFASSVDCTFAENAFVSARGMSNYERVEEEFTIPAGTHKLRFELTGGAGGTYEKGLDGGSGAKVSGIVEVKPNQTVKIIAGGGGSFAPEYYPSGEGYRTAPVKGGYGFGDGGSTPEVRIPNDVMDKVYERWVWAHQWSYRPNPSPMEEVYGCSGGGSSALLIDGEVIAVAGGGGGVSIVGKPYTAEPNHRHFPGIVDVRMTGPEHPTHAPVYSAAGVAGGARGGDATEGHEYYAQDVSLELTVEGGKGGGNGIGGAGGAKPTVLTGTPNSIFSFDSQNKQVLYSSSTAGNPGTNGLQGNGGDGVMSVSYQLDDNEARYRQEDVEVLEFPDGTREEIHYYGVAPYFNGGQIIVSGAGGGGYGGGGSGAALSQSSITIAQKWNNNPKGVRQSISYVQLAGSGGAGGSYLAPQVMEGEISNSNNVTSSEVFSGATVSHDGIVKVFLCQVGK